MESNTNKIENTNENNSKNYSPASPPFEYGDDDISVGKEIKKQKLNVSVDDFAKEIPDYSGKSWGIKKEMIEFLNNHKKLTPLPSKTKIDAVIGGQNGDESKGQVTYNKIKEENYDIVCQNAGGSNAGHTVVIDDGTPEGNKFKFNQLSCGLLFKDTLYIMGIGKYINPQKLLEEVKNLEEKTKDSTITKRILISKQAPLVLPFHIEMDKYYEKKNDSIGSTKQGIAYCASQYAARQALRVVDLFLSDYDFKNAYYNSLPHNVSDFYTENKFDFEKEVAEFIDNVKSKFSVFQTIDVTNWIESASALNLSMLCECSQGVKLNLKTGVYPFVTSSDTTTNGIVSGLGVNHTFLGKVTMVIKPHETYVGNGYFVNEMKHWGDEEMAGMYQTIGKEIGTVSGRKRRIGYFCLPSMRKTLLENKIDQIHIAKVDVIEDVVLEWNKTYGNFPEVSIITEYKKKNEPATIQMPCSNDEMKLLEPVFKYMPSWLDVSKTKTASEVPKELLDFIDFIETTFGIPVKSISNGPKDTNSIKLK